MNILDNNLNENEYIPRLEELRDAYLYAGLPPANALEAAIADLADLYNKAA